MLIFRKMRWKNILSTGNSFTEIHLDKYNSTLVSGDNGAGKSTMLDSLTFCLFGKSFRGIKNTQLINSINEKDCVVEVEFSINKHNYMVRRGMKPKLFEIIKDGSLIPQNATVKDYQNILEEQILKMSYKAFCQVVILGSSNYIPFMKLPTKDRKIVVEDLLDISIFSTMFGIIKTRLSENKDKILIASSKIDSIKSNIESHKRIISRMEEKSDESIKKHKQDINNNEKQISELRDEIEECNKIVQSLKGMLGDESEAFSKLSKAESLESKIKDKDRKLSKDIDFYKENDHCPTCEQKITEIHKDKMVRSREDKKSEIKSALESIRKSIEDAENRVSEINRTNNEIEEVLSKISEKRGTISACEKYVDKIRDKLEDVSSDKEELDDERENLEKMEAEYDSFESKRKVMVDDRTELEVIGNLIKDTGIKSRIIKYYLPIMNSLINQYLTSMDFFCQFSLDENFDETIKSRYRDEFTYFNFSEGERLRIDLSLLLAWREIARLKNSVNCNLLVLDEVFDSSLDSVGTEEFMKILNSLGKKANVFVITHKSDQLMDKFDNNLHFSKKGNFSDMTFRMHKTEGAQ